MTGFYVFFLAFIAIGGKPYDKDSLCNFMTIERISHAICWTPPPPRKPSKVLKLTMHTGMNEDEKAKISDDFDEGMDIEDIVDDIGIENIFKYNFRFRYKFKSGDKIYVGTQLKGEAFSPYFGLFLNL